MSNEYTSAEDAIAGNDPQWRKAGRVHDWRNHVPDDVQELWATFTREQRGALVRWANELSDNEKWE